MGHIACLHAGFQERLRMSYIMVQNESSQRTLHRGVLEARTRARDKLILITSLWMQPSVQATKLTTGPLTPSLLSNASKC